MSDPFAAVFAAIVAWRSLVFAKHPTWKQAVWMGVLMTAVTMAKLTMGLVPTLPIAASFIYWTWEKGSLLQQGWAWLKTYFGPLAIAGAVSLLLWSPILIPAYIHRDDDPPFQIVDTHNIQTTDVDEHGIGDYLWAVLPIVSEWTTRELLLAAMLAAGYWLGMGRINAVQLRNGMYIITWLLAMALPTLYGATIITSRYFMPLSAPFVLLVAYLLVSLWDGKFFVPVVRLAVVGVAGFWVVTFAYPFTRDTLNDPIALPLTGTSLIEYLSGNISADIAIQRTGAALDELNPPPERIYVNWSVCPMLYLYTEQKLTCLDRNLILTDLTQHLNAEMPDCGESIFVVSGYPDSARNVYGVEWEQIAVFQRSRVNRPVQIWRARWQDKCVSQ